MSFITKISLVLVLFGFNISNAGAAFSDFINGGSAPTVRYCNTDWECGLEEGTQVIEGSLDGIVSDRSASEYIQDIIIYLLGFLFLIAVIYIIYAWFQILIAAWDEEKLKKSKNIIIYAFIGLVIIFLAWSIVRFMFNVIGA